MICQKYIGFCIQDVIPWYNEITVEETEGVINSGKYRENSHIGNTRQRGKTTQTNKKPQHMGILKFK